ncbi:MAG: tpn50 [Bacteroidetes bacterium]|nr:MAG: tpn50 [Bacteroidota bacterium]
MKNLSFRTAILAIVMLLPVFSGAQPNLLDKGGDQVKLFNASQAFNGGDYVKALNLYKEVQANTPNVGSLAYHVGECYYMMRQYDEALESLEKAKALDANSHVELNLMLGKTYQVKGQTDKAIEALNAFKAASTNDLKKKETDYHLSQCNNAKTLMAKGSNVTITNVGASVNSPYDDKRPSITADGKTMIFTSRRPEGKTSTVDKEGDSGYFDDIYLCTWNEEKQIWNDAELIKGSVNSAGHDASCSISPDGKLLYIYQNNAETGSSGGDIYVSKRGSAGKWGSPKNMGKKINTSYFEDNAVMMPDASKLFIMSERGQDLPWKGQKGFGRSDIWICDKVGKSDWNFPMNAGAEINSEYDEGGMSFSPDGKTLYFCSNGPGSMGGYDIFKSTFENGKWGAPVNMGYPINTIYNDKIFIVAPDGKTAYIDSDREGSIGDRDLWIADITDIMKPKAKLPIPKSVLKGTIFDGNGVAVVTEVAIYDESGAKVTSVQSSSSGNYEVQLDGGKTYEARLEMSGFKKISEKVELKQGPEGGPAFELVKHYILYKE